MTDPSLQHPTTNSLLHILLLLAMNRLLVLTSLIVRRNETVLTRLRFDLCLGQARELLRGLDVAHLLHVSLCEDEVDLFQASLCGLRVEEPDEGEEDGVEYCEKEVGTPTKVSALYRL